MWQVIITEVIREESTVITRAILTDGSSKIPKEYRITTELQLKKALNDDIANLSTAGSEFPKLATGPYDPTITPPEQTPEELARFKYADDVDLLAQYARAIALKVLQEGDQNYTDQLNKVVSGFKTEYLDLF